MYEPYGGGYPYGGYQMVPQPKNDGVAIGSMVLGIVSIVLSWMLVCVLGPVALIMGIASVRRIRASGGYLGGGGMAVAGIITGAIGTLILILWLVFFGFAVAVGTSHPGG